MSDSTRRGFLKYAGAGAAAAGVAAVVPAVAHENAAAKKDVALPKEAAGSLVAYVHDVHSGEVALMIDGREVTVTDHELVARLAHALHNSPSV